MKKTYLFSLMIFVFGLTMLSACGSGGGGTQEPQQPASKTTAVVKIATAGQLAQGTMIGGITVTGILPAGVTIKASPDAQNPLVRITDRGAVVASGVAGTNASALATYSPADRKVDIYVYGQDGFVTGEFATVTCDIAPGSTPAASDFSLTGFDARDLNGAAIPGLAPGFTVDIQ